MSAQTRYGFKTQIGIAGGIADIAPYAIDTFLNEEATGTMAFGVGVVTGTKAGVEVKLPTSTDDKFEGVTVNNLTTEYDMDGHVRIIKGAAIGVMRHGRVIVRIADTITPAYGEAAYVVATGEQAGYFTNASSGLAVKGRFLNIIDTVDRLAEVELFDQAQA